MPDVEPPETVVTWKDLATAARRKAIRTRVWLVLIPLCLFLLALAVLAGNIFVRVLAVLMAIYIGSIPLWGPTIATWLQARRRTWPGHPTRWRVTSDGLAIETDDRGSTIPWSGLGDATSWRKGVSVPYGRAVLFIPARAFSGPDHRQAFVGAMHASTGGGPG